MTLGHMYRSRQKRKEQRQQDIESVLTFLNGRVSRKKIINFIEKYLVDGEL